MRRGVYPQGMLETLTVNGLPFMPWYWVDIDNFNGSDSVKAYAKQIGIVGHAAAHDVDGKRVQIFVYQDHTVQIRLTKFPHDRHPWEAHKLKTTALFNKTCGERLIFKPGDWIYDYNDKYIKDASPEITPYNLPVHPDLRPKPVRKNRTAELLADAAAGAFPLQRRF